ncbi:DUF2510 domain-containing protein, partial [Nocardioides stalactiti]|uniref:DUF2510 domain-containing protein n=1 Tax=Nocardioides stalactiti TaxID=2755356 RepID=UPI001601200C
MTAAAWHPDPTGRHELRYWDGTQWTEHVSDAGVQSTNPVAAPEEPAAQTTTDATAGSGTSSWDMGSNDATAVTDRPDGSMDES